MDIYMQFFQFLFGIQNITFNNILQINRFIYEKFINNHTKYVQKFP